jgi:uncharacterized protein (TIGR02246 family)
MRAFILALSVLLLVACASQNITGEGSNGAKDQVASATAAWVAAYNTRDPARITALYDQEAVLWGTSAKTVSATPSAIAEYFKDAKKRPDARVTLGEQHIRVYGDVAISTGYYTFTDMRDGKSVTNPSRHTFVYRYRDGKWLIVDHHSSRVP